MFEWLTFQTFDAGDWVYNSESTYITQLDIDASLHRVPWRKLEQWAPPARYTLTGTTSNIIKF